LGIKAYESYKVNYLCLVHPPFTDIGNFPLLLVAAAAQELAPVEHQDFKKLRYEEDYEYLADPQRRTTLWESIKYIPLGFVPRSYLSLGGEIRERYE